MKKIYTHTLLMIILVLLVTHESYASAIRTITTENCTTTVTIQTQFNINQGAYAVKEILPEGLFPYYIQQNGIWDETDRSIIWGAFPDKNNREFSYNVSGEAIAYSISGLISIDGISQVTGGPQQLTHVICPLEFLSDSLSAGQLDTLYKAEIVMKGGKYPLSFSIAEAETLPPGLALSSKTGIISGIPEKTGNYDFTVIVTDAQNTNIQQNFHIEVTEKLIIVTDHLPNVSQDSMSLLTILADGGKKPYTFSHLTGTLPPDITIEKDGTLMGTFTTPGQYEFVVNLTDANHNAVDQDFKISVYDSLNFGSATRHIEIEDCASRIVIHTQLPEVQGSYAVMELLPEGVLPYSISYNGRWNPEDRTLEWGAYSDLSNQTFSYNVSGDAQENQIDGRISVNGVSLQISGEQTIILQSRPFFCPFNYATKELKPAQLNAFYSFQVVMHGGNRPFLFSKTDDSTLPPGISLDPSTGLLSGYPTQSGFFQFEVVCKDQINDKNKSQQYSLEVTEPLIFITDSMLKHAVLEKFETWNLEVQGGKTPYHFSLKWNVLPPGIELHETVISGVPVQIKEGGFDFTIQVTDAYNNTIDKEFNILVCEPLEIQTIRLPDAIVGKPYSYTKLTATGGFGSYQWKLYSGQLPEGIELDPSGKILGTPKESIYSTLDIAVIDEDGRQAPKVYTFQSTAPLSFESEELILPNALQNEDYSEIIRISGGIGPYTYVTSTLPDGLELDSKSGKIFGQAKYLENASISVQVTDSSWPESQIKQDVFEIQITADLTILSEAVLPHARRGQTINPILLSVGGGPSPYHWKVTDGYLPRGILLDSKSGSLSGMPVDKGDMILTFTVTDKTGKTAQKEFIWHIYDKVDIQTGFIPDAAVGNDYHFTLQVTGGIPPYHWQEDGTSLPPNLVLNPDTGTIFGKPDNQILQQIGIKVCDSDTSPQCDTQNYYLKVHPDQVYIYTPEIPNCPVNRPYIAEIEARSGKQPYQWQIINGTLPSGLTSDISGNTYKIKGTPTEAGEHEITLLVTDSSGSTVEKTFYFEILGELEIVTTNLPPAIRGVKYDSSIYVKGGLPPYTWFIPNEYSLPSGLTLSPVNGVITGIPDIDNGESKSFKVQVQDSGNQAKEQELTIYVTLPVKFITESIPNARQYERYLTTIKVEGGIQPYLLYIAQDDVLPEGLSLDSRFGILSGFPKEFGNFTFTISLSDATNSPVNNKDFQLTIFEGSPPEIVGGDLNGNERVQIEDAIIALQILTDFPGIPVFMPADTNQDDQVDMRDVLLIMIKLSMP